MTRRFIGRTALAAAVLMLATPAVPATAQSSGKPIPGIDIIVEKNPGGIAMPAGTSGRDGRFSARVRVERGEYEVTTACRPRTPCLPHRLVELMVDDRRILPDAQGRFSFPIPPPEDSDSVRLSGRVIEGPPAAGQRRLSFNFSKIDPVYTEQACSRDGGTVVVHERERQCRLPADGRSPTPPNRQ